jgi:S-DNA-T family DNA segregation ATPase FtsK/SpoIIIE
LLDEMRDGLAGRLPPPDLPLAQLRSRSRWSGSEVYVVVDDYDLIASGPGGGPLGSLLEPLPQAADIGFPPHPGPLGGVRPTPLPPGRGVLVRRRIGNSLVQVARSAQGA